MLYSGACQRSFTAFSGSLLFKNYIWWCDKYITVFWTQFERDDIHGWFLHVVVWLQAGAQCTTENGTVAKIAENSCRK
jgi:hypothetical protein